MFRRSVVLIVPLALSVLLLSGCEAVRSVGESIKSLAGDAGSGQMESAAGSGDARVAVLPENCPKLKIVEDLAEISQFAKPQEPRADELVSMARFTGLDAGCQVAGNSVILEMSLDFDGVLGPVGLKSGGSEANFAYPYFISVINPQGQILSKDVFALAMVYPQGQIQMHKQDRLRQVIPLMPGQSAGQFQVVVGFQLSTDELIYNRSKKQ